MAALSRSYAPLQPYDRSLRVRRRTAAHLTFAHEGGDDYGIFVDDVRLERLLPSAVP